MKRLYTFLATALLLLAGAASHAAQEERRFADRFVAQHAGYLGLFSVGVENIVGPHGSLQLMAGYAPASEEGIDIYVAAAKAKYRYRPLISSELAEVRLYTGIGLHYYFGDQYHVYEYPEGYYTYPANEWHLIPYLGITLTGNSAPHKDIAIYAEVGILDTYLIHYYNNYQTLDFGDAISLALGMSVPLH